MSVGKHRMIAIDLSKEQVLDANLKVIQQINFSGNLEETAMIFFIVEEVKETILDFSKGVTRVLWIYFVSIQYQYKNDSMQEWKYKIM